MSILEMLNELSRKGYEDDIDFDPGEHEVRVSWKHWLNDPMHDGQGPGLFSSGLGFGFLRPPPNRLCGFRFSVVSVGDL